MAQPNSCSMWGGFFVRIIVMSAASGAPKVLAQGSFSAEVSPQLWVFFILQLKTSWWVNFHDGPSTQELT